MARVLFLVSLCLLPSVVFGAEEHGNHEEAPGVGSLTFYFINFGLYVGALYFLLRSTISQGWQTRRAKIEESVTRGAKEIEITRRELAEAQETLAALPQKIEKLKAEIALDAEREAQQILVDAHSKAERVVAQASDSANAEVKAFEESLRKELANEVVVRAKAILEKELTADSDKARRTGAMSSLRALFAA